MKLPKLTKSSFLALWAASAVLTAAAQAPAATPQTGSAPAVLTPYRSAFDGYSAFTDEPVANWKAANDTTARIGGWREYAKQAQGLDSRPDNTPAPANKARAAAPEPIKKAQP